MDSARIGHEVLWLTAAILGLFGAVVAVASLVMAARGVSPRTLLTRYAAWLLIAPPFVLPLIYSRPLFQLLVLLLSLQCIREFARVTGLWADRLVLRTCYGLTVGLYLPVLAGWPAVHQAMPLVVLIVLLLLPILRGRYEHMLQEVSLSILAVLYFGWFLSYLACLRNFNGDSGVACIFLLAVLVGCNDSLAYLCGRCVGRHKLSPRISPNKTVEGAVLAAGGVIGLAWMLRRFLPALPAPLGPALVVALGGGVAALGICGDLVVSFIKRDLKIKDMGRAIPGHGGLLDRCDSLILAAPVFFYAMKVLYGA